MENRSFQPIRFIVFTSFFFLLCTGNALAGDPFGTEIGSFNGVVAYSNGVSSYAAMKYNYVNGSKTGMKWQCVEYVNRYYWVVYGKKLQSWLPGNANSFYNRADKIPYIDRFLNGGTEKPKVGDILVSHSGTYGHVALVREISSSSIYIIQQNYHNTEDDNRKRIPLFKNGDKWTVGAIGAMTIYGWIRLKQPIISGIVTDASDGKAVPGASITVSPGGYTAITGEDGSFRIEQITENPSYTITAYAEGYGVCVREGIVVKPGDVTTTDISLDIPAYVEVHPQEFFLEAPYPNPFNPSVSVVYVLPQNGRIEAMVYNLAGQRVLTLQNTIEKRGRHTITWDASGVPAGVYVIVVVHDGIKVARKVMLVK